MLISTYSHNFDFNINNVTILEFEPKLDKRLILEMIHTQRDNNTNKFRTDSQGLSNIYYKLKYNINIPMSRNSTIVARQI